MGNGNQEFDSALESHDTFLLNEYVKYVSWESISVTVNDKVTKKVKPILSDVSGRVNAGEMLALIGPSGSGKTTLIDVLARRTGCSTRSMVGQTLVNGMVMSHQTFRQLSSYVEQEDTLIGSLTVRETLTFAASSISKARRLWHVNRLISSFGLDDQADSIIGTPIQKGVSGGQKRRVTVASQLITGPSIIFLDEPTSGLDSVASYELISRLKSIAKKNNLIVIASIHQPSTSTFKLFDKLLLLSLGKTCYYGPVKNIKSYFDDTNNFMPPQTNPAEFVLELVNVDFASDRAAAKANLDRLHRRWKSLPASPLIKRIPAIRSEFELRIPKVSKSLLQVPLTLLHRSFIKSYRDVVAYGIRIAMYAGLAIMMGTVWLRLNTDQASIQPFVNAIFFGSAFMSFMAVAYVPAFLEDRATFVKERANGLYGATSFTIANFLIGLPYLFFMSFLFSTIAYWLSNFQPTASAFFTWIMWLFLDLLAAESLVVLVSSLFPNFVVALALTAFANGLWMSVGGFLVTPDVLNVFWRYVFHYIDYQAYVFQGMMVNEFSHRTYACGEDCQCMYQSALESECRIQGTAILETYQYAEGMTGRWVGILLAIVAAYRILGWVALSLRKT
ncbi:hypothetical protein MMC09_005022 [Bachmanniomyces sp. S44760]|nr:hypothetical protein [Bachmanniomyces sp. S44760]